MRVIFDPSTTSSGGGGGGGEQLVGNGAAYFQGMPPYQRGYGAYFTGVPHQRGAGIGTVFRKFWRFLKPLTQSLGPVMSSAGRAIGQEGLATTARVLSDVVQGNELKNALETEGRQGVRNLLGRAQRKLDPSSSAIPISAAGAQSGGRAALRPSVKRYKRRAPSRRRVILQPADDLFVGRHLRGGGPATANLNKKKRFDNLGQY
jgi:hypothetical protein